MRNKIRGNDEPDFVKGLQEQWFDEDDANERKIVGRLYELKAKQLGDMWCVRGEIRLLDGKSLKGIVYNKLDQETALLFAQTRGGTPVWSGSEALRLLQDPEKEQSVSLERKVVDEESKKITKKISNDKGAFDSLKPKFKIG